MGSSHRFWSFDRRGCRIFIITKKNNIMRLISHKSVYRYVLILFTVFYSFAISAQSVDIISTTVSGGKAIHLNNEWHALVDGTTATFELVFSKGSRDVTKASVSLHGLIEGYRDLNIDGTITIGPIDLPASTNGEGREVTFVVTYDYQTPRAGGGYDSHTAELPVVKSEMIHLYAMPQSNTDTSGKIYTDKNYTVVFQTEGGYESGWKTKVDSEGAIDGKSAVLKKPEDNLPIRKSQTVSVINYAPDGETKWWESEPYRYSVYYYNTPTCVSDPSNPTETNFYKNTGTNTWKVITDGGNPDGWVFEWMGGSEASDKTRAEYKPFVYDVAESQLSRTLKLLVKNVSDDGELLFGETEMNIATISVFRKITGSMALVSGAHDTKSYSGEEVTFETQWAALSEYPGYWVFHWMEGNSETIEQDVHTSIYKISPTESTSVTIQAEYWYNGKWEGFSKTYTATVFERPTVKTTEAVNLVKFNNRNVATPIDGATPKTADGNELPSIIADYDNKHVTGVDYEMIVGDKITLGLVPEGGAGDWEYSITVGENKSENASLTFVPTDAGEYTMSAKVLNGATLQNPYSVELTRRIKVYPKPDASPQSSQTNLYGTQSLTIKDDVSKSGGHAAGWEVDDWGGDDETIVTTDDVNEKTKLKESYTAVYSCSGYVRCSVSKTVNITVWPKPSISAFSVKLQDKEINTVKDITYYDSKEPCEETIDCYGGDKLIIAAKVEGGYADAATGSWSFRIRRDAEELENKTITVSNIDTKAVGTLTEPIELPNVSSASKTYQYTLEFTNLVTEGVEHGSETEFYSEPYKLKIVVWHKPAISYEMLNDSAGISWSNTSSTNRVQVYAGSYEANKVKFDIKKSYGYSNGWSYAWKLNGVNQSSNQETWTYVPQVNASYEDKIVTVDIVNCIGDNNGMSPVTKTYYLRVWHPVVFPSSFTIKDDNQDRYLTGGYLAVRENNTLRFSVEEMNYGYCPDGDKSGYRYIWTEGVSDNRTREWTKPATGDFSLKDQFCSVENTMGLQMESYGPYGHCWDVSQGAHTYYIYQRPTTPTSVIRKGNGNSGTLVCTINISDADLQNHEYYLVFGYVRNGQDIDVAQQKQEGEGLSRWIQNDVFKTSAVYYVYAKWVNDDGTVITSGKKYSDGTLDDTWDGSVYAQTKRAEIVDFESVEIITDVETIPEAPTLFGEMEDTMTSGVYDLKGRFVGTSLQGLPAGLYIIRGANGMCKKVVIR